MWLLEKNTVDQIKALGPAAREIDMKAVAMRISGEAVREDIGNTAQIRIKGILAKDYDFSMFFFGGTRYPDIVQALQAADADPAIKKIDLMIDSPGGNVLGYTETHDAIRAIEKPVRAVVSGMATSAAYGLATAANKIIASSRGDMLGSIGVATSYFISDDEIEIASTAAPKKRPDARTEEGQAVIREELDAIHEIFVKSIADGRSAATGQKISSKTVNTEYGQGAVVLARDALDRGMIDALVEGKQTAGRKKTASAQEVRMDMATLKAEHPALYAQIIAEGVAQERDRVVAHLTMGEGCKAMEQAVAAIRDGSLMTASLQAIYMTAGLKVRDLSAMAADNPEPGAVSDPAGDAGPDMEKIVADLVAQKMGMEA